MEIYIDESGGFQRSEIRQQSLSCVGAVVMPGRFRANIEQGFRKLTENWPKENGEVKGRLLEEDHFATLCEFLAPQHVLFETSVMDLNCATEPEIVYHRDRQAEGMTVNLTEEHSPQLVAEVERLRRMLEEMAPQLYAQAATLTNVAWRALEHGMLYHCQRFPGELARFRWIIDAKSNGNITRYEEWWSECVKPMLQSYSIRHPMAFLKGGDYSAYFRNFPRIEAPDYLKGVVKDAEPMCDLKAVFDRDMEFGSSSEHVGLQIADVLTNGIRRALSSRLQEKGWAPIRKLMVNHKKGAVRFISLGAGGPIRERPYAAVALRLARGGGRSMLNERRRERKRATC